jgi:GNAT superfamily N-acetyltransferase
MAITVRELTPELWPQLEALFGAKGACGGCWCMYWRQEKGASWAADKGAVNKRRFRSLVREDRAHGVLAFDGDEPVGWCAFDRRQELVKLDRAPSLACDDAGVVWSLPCFYVKAGRRGQGVATALLRGALDALRRRGVRVVEGYPVRPAVDGKKTAAAFAWTGTRSLFEAAGFQVVGNPEGGRQRVRKILRSRRKLNSVPGV